MVTAIKEACTWVRFHCRVGPGYIGHWAHTFTHWDSTVGQKHTTPSNRLPRAATADLEESRVFEKPSAEEMESRQPWKRFGPVSLYCPNAHPAPARGPLQPYTRLFPRLLLCGVRHAVRDPASHEHLWKDADISGTLRCTREAKAIPDDVRAGFTASCAAHRQKRGVSARGRPARTAAAGRPGFTY